MPGVLVSPATYVEVLDPILAAWKATAEVHADPELYRALMEAIDEGPEDFVEVSRPESCPSNVPHEEYPDTARWCSLSLRHGGPHMDRDGYVWNDRDAAERNVARMPLPCGWCFVEKGEEVHPHPECPESGPSEDAPDAFDILPEVGSIDPEKAAKALQELYGGDWSKHIVARVSGPDYVKADIPEQRDEEADCG